MFFQVRFELGGKRALRTVERVRIARLAHILMLLNVFSNSTLVFGHERAVLAFKRLHLFDLFMNYLVFRDVRFLFCRVEANRAFVFLNFACFFVKLFVAFQSRLRFRFVRAELALVRGPLFGFVVQSVRFEAIFSIGLKRTLAARVQGLFFFAFMDHRVSYYMVPAMGLVRTELARKHY